MKPTQMKCLRNALADFLPVPSGAPEEPAYRRREDRAHNMFLSPTHHLVYFPNVPRTSLLLPDGTDSLHSPGPPFTRRMWAGGTMEFRQDIQMDGSPYHCSESIEDVQARGEEGEEKIFVKINRFIFGGRFPGDIHTSPYVGEQRTLVFMRDNRQDGSPAVSPPSSKVLKPIQTPDFSHNLVPTRELLFRFSALTFNAHAIHLDKQFCREVEGHRNLLVQGPLTVLLMIEVLRTHLQTLAHRGTSMYERTPEVITHVEYRNLAPLYAEEEMKVCVKRKETENDQGSTFIWDVWIEGRDGGYAVKGTVNTLAGLSGVDKRIFSRSRKSVSGRAFAASQDDGLGGETIPDEQVAFQKSIDATVK